MTSYDRTSVTVGMILVGIVLLLVLEIPSRAFQFAPLGTPLTFRITGTWLASLLLVSMSCAGTEAIMRTHPSVRRRIARYTFPTWILPALTTLALTLFLPQSPNLFYWLLGLILGGAVLAWLILIQYRLLGNEVESASLAKMVRGLVAYLLALVFFASIYRTRLRSLVTATSIAVVASLISLSILDSRERALGQTAPYAAMIGLIMGEMTWALNYWRANVLSVGVLLMLLFYALVGIAREQMRGTLDRRVAVEFLIVVSAGIGIVILFSRR